MRISWIEQSNIVSRSRCIQSCWSFASKACRQIRSHSNSPHILSCCTGYKPSAITSQKMFVSNESIKEELNNDVLPPIAVIANFFSCGQRSIIAMVTINDPVTVRLYETAMKIIGYSGQHSRSNESKTLILWLFCASKKSQSCKIINTIATEPHRALQYVKNGQAYCVSLERKYEDICDNRR